MKSSSIVILAGLGLALSACGDRGGASKAFYTKAMQGDASEMMLGDLAAKQGASDEVRAYGATLHTDHAAAGEQVKQAAASAGVSVPAEPTKEARGEYEKLSKMSGADFDKEFARYMVDDHKKDIADFEKAAKSSDAKVAKLAGDTLPTLRKHLEIAQSLPK
jgi:putative membrane protein